MPEKLSLLVFSRNDIEDALGLIRDLYGIADDIVLIDSSDKKAHKRLLTDKERLGLEKLRVFYVVPIGYPDPLRMYALKKCRYKWVLLVDTDERLSSYAKGAIMEMINDRCVSAFAIKRYEYVNKEGSHSGFFTWQVRLFRKDRVTFRGIIHEQPVVKGHTARAIGDFYISHMSALGKHSSSEYMKMAAFDRMSYEMFRERLIDYANKALLPERDHIKNTALGRSIAGLLKAYQMARGRKDNQELSYSDYLLFYYLVDKAYRIKEHGLRGLLSKVQLRKKYLDMAEKAVGNMESGEVFEISKAIGRVGVTRYLGLDDESVINRINRRYRSRRGGVDLLMTMLKERHEKGRGWLN